MFFLLQCRPLLGSCFRRRQPLRCYRRAWGNADGHQVTLRQRLQCDGARGAGDVYRAAAASAADAYDAIAVRFAGDEVAPDDGHRHIGVGDDLVAVSLIELHGEIG